MKRDDKYRFSLQFGTETNEQKCVGDFLERLGNKKSAIIVAAVSEYLVSHPELQSEKDRIEVRITSELSQDKIEQMLKAIIDERLASLQMADTPSQDEIPLSDAMAKDIDQMLGNLELF